MGTAVPGGWIALGEGSLRGSGIWGIPAVQGWGWAEPFLGLLPSLPTGMGHPGHSEGLGSPRWIQAGFQPGRGHPRHLHGSGEALEPFPSSTLSWASGKLPRAAGDPGAGTGMWGDPRDPRNPDEAQDPPRARSRARAGSILDLFVHPTGLGLERG